MIICFNKITRQASVNVLETNRKNKEISAKPTETQVASGNQEQTVTRRYPSRMRRVPDLICNGLTISMLMSHVIDQLLWDNYPLPFALCVKTNRR